MYLYHLVVFSDITWQKRLNPAANNLAWIADSCALAAGYLIFKWLSGFSWFRAQIRKRPSKAPVAPAAPVEGAENEWLKGTFYKGQQTARPRGKA